MNSNLLDTDQLVTQAANGNMRAMDQLLTRYRGRLRRMVAVRLDQRVESRVDPSDVVQEALTEAAQQIQKYAQSRPVSFYPWLRQIAWQRLVKIHRQHIEAACRSVTRERDVDLGLSGESVAELSRCVVSPGLSPSRQIINQEMQRRVQTTLEDMKSHDREILVLRYLEQLSMAEIGEIVGVSAAAARKRHARALGRLQQALSDRSEG